MKKQTAPGRALFYSRDSGGEHETTPGEYIRWAQREATNLGVAFSGTPEQLDAMIRGRCPHDGDLYFDNCVTGNKLSRAGLDALIKTALAAPDVTHVLIPRRDRLARPDDPTDGLKLEHVLREGGLTLVFMDRTLKPLSKGSRRDIGELIVAMLDYNYAGEFRRELAQKMIYAQTALAKAGFSVGGRPPYGFRRWLARQDGTAVRQLADGEKVRMAGHHVVWLPGSEDELAVIRRILTLLETIPAARVAALLTAEGVPTPDHGRTRTDRGIEHQTSGVWRQTTVVSIGRNPLLRALVVYGRRSMGDQLRYSPEGPRPLGEPDYRPDEKPKVVSNPPETHISAPARFEPLVDAGRHERLLRVLDERAGTQRGKPRSREPERNPLGGRAFDMNCGWAMYREPYQGSFRYKCGLYQQSHGSRCRHNHVHGPTATQFLLSCIRQRILAPSIRTKLEERLRRIAALECGTTQPPKPDPKRSSLADLERKLDRAKQNMALAANEEQFRAVAAVIEQMRQQRDALQAELRSTEVVIRADPEAEVAAALGLMNRLGELAERSDDFSRLGELFSRVNARLFLRFREAPLKKRTVNRVAGGVVTFGGSAPPVALYDGPTARPKVKGPVAEATGPDFPDSPGFPGRSGPGGEGESSGNVRRGDWIRTSDLLNPIQVV
jgi:hypothetical protein